MDRKPVQLKAKAASKAPGSCGGRFERAGSEADRPRAECVSVNFGANDGSRSPPKKWGVLVGLFDGRFFGVSLSDEH